MPVFKTFIGAAKRASKYLKALIQQNETISHLRKARKINGKILSLNGVYKNSALDETANKVIEMHYSLAGPKAARMDAN